MKEIIATEQIFSPITNKKSIAIRYHYADGTFADAPIIRKTDISELSDRLRKTIEVFGEEHLKGQK